jgi:hypothetical protein
MRLVQEALQVLIPAVGYDLANQTAYLDGMLRWGLDWMIKVGMPYAPALVPRSYQCSHILRHMYSTYK